MENKFKEVLVLEGGYNEEHKVSLKTAKEVKKILKLNNIAFKSLIVKPETFKKDIKKYKNFLCFNALHGPFGEDGKIQEILNKNNILYTHSNSQCSKLCFNKLKTKKLLKKNKILVPNYLSIRAKEITTKKLKFIKDKFSQFVIKPSESGSSFGVHIIKNDLEFKLLLKNIKKIKKELINHTTLLIEEYVNGTELTVSVTKFNKKIKPLAVTEIKPKTTFFDYKAKYSKGFSKHILPANLKIKKYNQCMGLAKKVHKIFNCNSISRSDFIYDPKSKKIYFLEVNTQPGLTQVSLTPEQAKYKKISFNKLILGILENIN